MVDVAGELGVDAIGLNHLMYSTPEEVAETVRLIGASDASVIATFVTPDPGLDRASRAQGRSARRQVPRAQHPLRLPAEGPSAADGQLLHAGSEARRPLPVPLPARAVAFSGKVYFCPFIRVEVGDLATSSLEEIWNGETYVEMRRRLLEHGIFPVCRRCCKVELSPDPVAQPFPEGVAPRRAIPLTVVHQ